MENGGDLSPKTTTNITRNNSHQTTGRARSGSASSGHKRSVSESLLSKLSFLRMSQTPSSDNIGAVPAPSSRNPQQIGGDLNNDNNGRKPTTTATSNNDNIIASIGGARGGVSGGSRAMATAIQNQHRKMRRRRGSLRKTALLGTRLELKEKRNNNASTARDQNGYGNIEHSNFRVASSPLSSSTTTSSSGTSIATTRADEELTPKGSMDRTGNHTDSAYSGYWPLSLTMDKSPTSTSLVGDTTDEEDNPYEINNNNIHHNNHNTGETTTHIRPSSTSSSGSAIPPPLIATPSSSSESYFLQTHHQATSSVATTADTSSTRPLSNNRPTTTHRARSPLVVAPSSIEMSANHHVSVGLEVVGGWDYSETEWWGWIILIVTWVVFVIGIGSSFGVWSWAWDVGETPYAPPELEDDPTLPIVGYYPALLVLTAVMAWVWVVVAWVGMKYFKHANISADDG